MQKSKKKGYVLAVVIILVLVMTLIITSVFSIIMRYFILAKESTQGLSGEVVLSDLEGGNIY